MKVQRVLSCEASSDPKIEGEILSAWNPSLAKPRPITPRLFGICGRSPVTRGLNCLIQ